MSAIYRPINHQSLTRNPDIVWSTEYIKNVLYFAVVRAGKEPNNTQDTHYFSIDKELVYEPYYSDFGPLNLGCVYKYCVILNNKLKLYLNKQIIVHYTTLDVKKKANAAFLLGCYGVLYLSLPPKDALRPLLAGNQSYRPFQDATQGDSLFTITLLDCLQAIRKARELGFFNFRDFNYEEYDKLDKIQGGDLNWIVPDKFLAFIGPVDYNVTLYHPPDMYIDYFLYNNVKLVIRLNKRQYDGSVFTKAGIPHCDLYFPDGSCPTRNILARFLQICEETRGAIAVHCKAGLGRTGSLIGCYLIKHYRMTAHEAIGWMRICRPGSVIGHQQRWLEQLENWLLKQGNLYRKRVYQNTEYLPSHQYGVYSIAQKTAVIFDKSQSPPPPPMLRQPPPSIDVIQAARPKASKIREALKQTLSKEQQDALKSTKMSMNKKSPNSEKTVISSERTTNSALSRRGSGAGEPRPSRPPSRGSSARSQAQRTANNINIKESKNSSGFYPMATGKHNPVPLIKNVDDAKNFLLNSSRHEKNNYFDLPMTVTPHYSFRVSCGTNNTTSPSRIAATPISYTAASRNTPSANSRRRLGRSPSPPQPRPLEHSKATNTPVAAGPSDKQIRKKSSKAALKDALAGLLVVLPRDLSAGAASLGARRTAPAPLQAPSVRSDERPLATQGDLLNSIKFQRRFRDNPVEKFTPATKENISVHTLKDKTSVKNVPSKTNTKLKMSQEATRARASPTRPLSPKGRRFLSFY